MQLLLAAASPALAQQQRLPLVRDAEIDALLLGCTHYPFLARTISDVMGPTVTLVSSADETAFAARAELARLDLLREPGVIGEHRFFSSGDIDVFRELGGRLLGPELAHTERWPLDHGLRTPPRHAPDPSPDPSPRTRRPHDPTR